MERRALLVSALGLTVLAGTGIALFMRRRREGQRPIRVVALGDSITAHGGYARKLKAILPPGSVVEYRGFPGKGAQAIYQMLPHALHLRPTHLVVLAGVNDLASGRSLQHTKDWLTRIYRDARRAGVKVVAVTVLPWKGYLDRPRFDRNRDVVLRRWADLNGWIRTQAPVDHVVDTMELSPSGYLPRGWSHDGLHPNETGHTALAQLIYRKVW